MPRKSWSKMTNKEKLDELRGELLASTTKFNEIEQRLDEIKRLMMREASRLSGIVAEVNVRLSSVAANVLEVSAVAARAADMADKSAGRPQAWLDRHIELKK